MASNPVHFDGSNDFLSRGDGLTGLSDGRIILFSTWFRITGGTGTDRRIFTIQNPSTSKFFVFVNSSNLIHVRALSPTNATVLDVIGPTAITDSDWHHFVISCNLTSAAQRAFYVDGVAVSPTWDTYVNTNIDLSPIGADVQVGCFDDTQFFWVGDLADLYFTNPGAWWNPATGGNLAKLIVDGAPPDPFNPTDVTGVAPKVFLGGATSTWHTNQGTGGGFTENGALTDGVVPLPGGGSVEESMTLSVAVSATMVAASEVAESLSFGIVQDDAEAGLSSDGTGAISAPITLGALISVPPLIVQTIGEMSGGGNLLHDSATVEAHKITDLTALHCGMARISAASPANQYFQGEAPSPGNFDSIVVALLQAGIQPYFSFVFTDHLDSSLTGIPARNYSDWFDIGAAFAARFRAGSTFLTGVGIPNLGVYGYSAINEPDVDSGEILPDPPTTFGLTYAEYHDMLEGLADGVHSEEPDGKVFPAGYLSGNRDQEYTGHGYCDAVADLINDGTLAGFDLHTYHSMTGAKIHDTWGRSHQSDVDAFITACGITRQDIEIICTETNIRGDPDATTQGYDEETAREWFLTSMFDVWGTLRPDGEVAQGPRFPWQLWTTGNVVFHMASQEDPRVELWCGHTYKMLMDLLWDMTITFSDPRDTGVLKLEGGGKTAWVFQNIHSSWTSLSGSTFTISDIPIGTTEVEVYDGNGLITTVSTPTLQVPEHTFSTPTGKSYLFVGNVPTAAESATLSAGAQFGMAFQAAVESDPSVSLSATHGAWMDSAWMDSAWMGGADFGALEVSEQIDVGIGLGDDQAAVADLTGVATASAILQVSTDTVADIPAAATSAAALGATFEARVNAAAATIQAASFATTQATLASFPGEVTANVLFDTAQVARTAVRGAFSASTSFATTQPARAAALGAFSAAASLNDAQDASNAFSGAFTAATSLAAAQVARAAARGTVPAVISLDDIEAASPAFAGAFSAATSLAASQVARAAAIEALAAATALDDIEAESSEFTGAFFAAAALDDTQAASVDGAGVVPVSVILASSQVATSAQMATVIDAAVAAAISAFSETPTAFVGIVTFELFLPTTQVAEAELDAEVAYAAALASTHGAQAAIDAAVAYAATLASAQVAESDLDASVTYPAEFASAETGGGEADAEIVVTTIVDAAQIAKSDLDAAISYAAEFASTQEARAAIDAAVAYAVSLALAQVAKADLAAAVTYPAAFSSIEIGTSGATLDVVAATIFDTAQIARTDLDGAVAAPMIAGASQAAIATRTGTVAAPVTAATATVVVASLDGAVPAAVDLDDIEALAADFSGVIDAQVDFATDQAEAVSARAVSVAAAALEIVPNAESETEGTVIVLADFAATVASGADKSAEMSTGDVQMSVTVVGGAQWLGTYLHAKWPNIGVAA